MRGQNAVDAILCVLLLIASYRICVVSSYALWNAALCQPAVMDSVYGGGTPDRAVDGNRNPNYGGASCIHSRVPNGGVTWWMVDLTEECLVHEVIITNRNGFSGRLQNATVDLFLADPRESQYFPTEPGIPCTSISQPLPGGSFAFPCAMQTWARYVKLTKFNPWELHICELEVMVSQRGNEPYQGKTSRGYRRFKNSEAQDGPILLTVSVAKGMLACSVMCTKIMIECTAFHWIEATKSCQLLGINPDSYGTLSYTHGTDFYVRKGAGC